MRNISVLALFAALACFSRGAESPYQETRTTIEKWVETRNLISRTKTEWAGDKDALLQTRQLFERELETVRKSLAGIETNSTQVLKEQSAAESERKELLEALELAAQRIAELEKDVRKLLPLLPEPLLETLQPVLIRLPENPAKTKASAIERAQAVVSVLNEIDKFNNSITVVNERRSDAAGAQINVDTLYLGLAVAYFVEPSGKSAGIGAPSERGWQWKSAPEIAPAVKDVIAIYRSQKPASFTALPATIQ
jgi:septal ring factor EnvC (AmiA/AmiB activator)